MDSIYIGYLSSRQASQFDTGAGNDLISYYASRFYKTAYLNSGAGADTVALDVNIYDDNVTVDTGAKRITCSSRAPSLTSPLS